MTEDRISRSWLVPTVVVANLVITILLLFRISAIRAPDSSASTTPSTDEIDATLSVQFKFLGDQIDGLGKITKANIAEAAQLWREAQLTLEAAVSTPDTRDSTRLRNTTITLQKTLDDVIPPIVSSAYNQARQKATLKDALTQWAGAGAYLSLLPNDGMPASAERAQAMGYEHERVRQELLQKAQTKYNLWACDQIKKSWVDIKEVNSPVSKSDNQKFHNTCIHFLAHIDSSLLDMSTGELYREVLQFVRERMPLEDFQNVIKEIQNGSKASLDSI